MKFMGLKNSLFRYVRLGRAYWSSVLPTYMVFFVTARCNARCEHCFYWREVESADSSLELSFSEIKKISGNLPGLAQISLTGGEPFLRKDFSEIIKVFYQLSGTRFFTISTNGSLTADMEKVLVNVLTKTPEAFYRISISMDDIEQAHDKNRKIIDLSNKIKETVKMLNKLQNHYPQIAISMTTTMDANNQANLQRIYEYIKANFCIDDWGVGLIRGNPRDKLLKDIDLSYFSAIFGTIKHSFQSRSWLTGQLRKLLLYEHTLKVRVIQGGKQVIRCLAGKKMIVLRENGNVEPCEMLDCFLGKDSLMGNLRNYDYSLKKLIQNEKSHGILQFIASGRCYCTYECALHCSIFYNLFELLKAFFKNPCSNEYHLKSISR